MDGNYTFFVLVIKIMYLGLGIIVTMIIVIIIIRLVTIIMKVIFITIIIVKIAEALRLGNFLLILTYIARNKNEVETLNFVSDHGSGSITFIFL